MQAVYLITGATSDVGMAFLQKLNETVTEDIIIFAQYRSNKGRLEEAAKNWKHLELRYFKADLAKTEDVKRMISEMKETGLQLTHILHLAAAPLEYMRIKQWDEDKVKEDMQIQVFSFAEIAKEFLPSMAKKRFGKIVVVLSSVTLGTPPKFMSNYVTVKYALCGYMKGMAAEYADKGININAISPNMMDTKFLKKLDPKIVQLTAEQTMLKRNITVEETVKGIEFLLSDASSYINGINLNLSGGDYM
ncbi:MAG: SDR family NAD(P)-dependent oxidoreductase [Lachnospiraceae bacterium]|nr:SDR family NAD(P)-dependent oxidoreductase [Lachnospiraceae bacterium]